VLPEALIASMLGPEEFGLYYAVHHEREARRAAIFYELDLSFRSEFFNIDEGLRRCVPHSDGRPKRSVYISVYRVLEHVPMSVIRQMYLVGPDGESLQLSARPEPAEATRGLHLYQEIAPTSSLVVSSLSPSAFFDLMVNDKSQLVSLPALCFMEQELGELAQDPAHGSARDLPYVDLSYLRESLLALDHKGYPVKIVYPTPRASFEYRTIKGGIYIGNGTGRLFFQLPDVQEYRQQRFKYWDLWARNA
jgi:hypothetical protein